VDTHTASLPAESADAIEWATRTLEQSGTKKVACVTPVRIRPWSSVYRLHETPGSGSIYLKVPHSAFRLDGHVMGFLGRELGGPVPEILDIRDGTGDFTMRDCGRPLRDIINEGGNPRRATDIIRSYSRMQVNAVGRINDLKALGVPEITLASMPEALLALTVSGVLEHTEGMTREDIDSVRQSLPLVAELCRRLETYRIPSSIEHGDLHDNNILVGDASMAVSDFGDATIAHPFFSLACFLYSFRNKHADILDGATLDALRQAYLEEWLSFGTMEFLESAFRITDMLSPIRFALGFARLKAVLTKEQMAPYQGYIAEAVTRFSRSMAATDKAAAA
jgi:tRNA A-37 threonylcarbamoyl transferase component Bud32